MSNLVNPYRIEIECLQEKPGCWNRNKVNIFKDNKKIGSYIRNYPSHVEDTFFPFQCNGKWLALISSDYTCTQIMDLESGKIIGGEKPSPGGFCPVEFWIPKRFKYTLPDMAYYIYEDGDGLDKSNPDNGIIGEEEYSPYGFVAGCVWGDDSSWKIQFLDLSNADKGILKREDKFDYAQLPYYTKLKDAVNIEEEDEDLLLINLKVLKRTFVKI